MRLDNQTIYVFDLDDTLYLERDYVLSGFRAVGGWLQSECDWSSSDANAFGLTCSELFCVGRRGNIFDLAMKQYDRTHTLARQLPSVDDLVHAYRSHRPKIQFQPDAQQLLVELRRVAASCWVITDGPLLSQRRKAESLALADWVDGVIFTDHWGRSYWKPHERAFREVERRSGGQQQQCIYFADNPSKDFEAPARRGWQTMRIRRPAGLHAATESAVAAQPDCVASDLSEVAAQITPVAREPFASEHRPAA